MTRFTTYIALGDSMSIDLYPELDAREQSMIDDRTRGLGAASLFFRNNDQLWPEFESRDLVSRGTSELLNLCTDGATTPDLTRQLQSMKSSDEPTLITITIGGNDLLQLVFSGGTPDPPRLDAAADAILGRITSGVRTSLAKRPDSTLLLTTVYDPTDRSWQLPSPSGTLDLTAWSAWFFAINDGIRRIASEERCVLADVDEHFRGHGWQSGDRWYWPSSIIEPSARGASEIRRVWLAALE